MLSGLADDTSQIQNGAGVERVNQSNEGFYLNIVYGIFGKYLQNLYFIGDRMELALDSKPRFGNRGTRMVIFVNRGTYRIMVLFVIPRLCIYHGGY
jgi:hypothetical protein